MRRKKTLRSIATLLLVPVLITGCGGDDEASAFNFGSEIRGLSASGRIHNAAPTLSGAPTPQAPIDAYYEFTPTASDPDGHALEFTITNRPSWATFDARTGRLGGTPTTNDAGVYANIIIAASDGRASAALGPFTIAVGTGLAALPGTGTAELSWSPPTQNSDGTPAIDLAGYRVYYGQDPQALGYSASLTGAQVTQYLITGLQPGTWYFAVAAVAANGIESELSEIGSKTIG
jgi:hypothetical protein